MGATAVFEIAAAIPPAKKSLAKEIAVSLIVGSCCCGVVWRRQWTPLCSRRCADCRLERNGRLKSSSQALNSCSRETKREDECHALICSPNIRRSYKPKKGVLLRSRAKSYITFLKSVRYFYCSRLCFDWLFRELCVVWDPAFFLAI